MREERFKEVVREAEAKFAEIHDLDEIVNSQDEEENRGTMLGMMHAILNKSQVDTHAKEVELFDAVFNDDGAKFIEYVKN